MATCISQAARADQPLLLIDSSSKKASFVGCESEGMLQFRFDKETRTVALRDIVRWSTLYSNLEQHEIVLVDGSRLVVAASWAGKESLQVSKDTVTATTKLLGKVSFPRTKLRAILINAPAASLRRMHLLDRLLASKHESDQLQLTNGDFLTGKLNGLGPNGITFTLDSTDEPIVLAADRVAGLACGSSPEPATGGNLAVGLGDGSYLVAKSLAAKSNSFQIELACGIRVAGDALGDIVHLQSLGYRAVYLSDLDAAEYRHEPYLDIPWSYRRDRNVLGGPLTVAELIYAKGLGMHTASWLTYDLSPQSPGDATSGLKTRYRRFAAQVAVDDSAGGYGSVIFQVFLRQAGTLELAFATPILYGGDAPLPISIELGDAEQIVLVADYADRGDQCDYANWLDARFE